jgi:sugar/nucleoside kinase (ribokinase family)
LIPRTNDVVVVGNIGIDTNVYFAGDQIDFSVEANFTTNVDMIGQAGGYASRGYARLGMQTAFIGYIGADYSGDHIRRTLGKEQIDLQGLFIDPAGTSRSINLLYQNGQRKNCYDGKSHMQLEPHLQTCEQVFRGARLAHFNIPNWARRLLPLAKEAGAKIACDIQDVVNVEDPYRSDFILAADYLFFSAANYSDPAPLIRDYLHRNPEMVVICGMGARGCALGTGGEIRYFPTVSLDLPVVDTNGAGDSLAVGFLTSHVLDGLPLEESILRGQIAARYKCAIRASSSNLITRELLAHYREQMK